MRLEFGQCNGLELWILNVSCRKLVFGVTVEKAAQIAHAAAFANGGQCCCAGTRTYVQAGIYDQFVQKAADIAVKRTVGNPFEEVQQGPQVTHLLSLESI